MIQWMIMIYLFVLGLFFGSFFNCMADRLSNNESIFYPGSHCDNCKHRLAWYELIPVFSYLFQGGKCSKCKIKLSFWYPLTEILTGVLFAFSFYLYGFSYQTILSIIVCSVFMVTIISDAKYMIILDEILVAGVICASVVYFLDSGMVEVAYRFLYGLVLFSIMLLIKVFGDTAFKQESLGWGDIKLSFFVGLVLGIKMGIMYIFLGAFLALPYALFQTIKKKNNILPFGPFLVLAFILLFWNYEFVSSTISMLYGGVI